MSSRFQHGVKLGDNEQTLYALLNVYIADLSAAASHYVVSPYTGDVVGIYSVINGSVDADTTLTAKIGGAAITGGAITITALGSAAGDVDSATPTGNNSISAGSAIEIVCGGEGLTASSATVTLVIELT